MLFCCIILNLLQWLKLYLHVLLKYDWYGIHLLLWYDFYWQFCVKNFLYHFIIIIFHYSIVCSILFRTLF